MVRHPIRGIDEAAWNLFKTSQSAVVTHSRQCSSDTPSGAFGGRDQPGAGAETGRPAEIRRAEGEQVTQGSRAVRSRYRQLVRCLRLVRDRAYAQSLTGARLAHLARLHGVCPRTIRRDLQALREAGYGDVSWTEATIPGDITS